MPKLPETTTRTAADAELDAFNAAFDELGFGWHWDRATMAELAAISDDNGRVRAYVQRHHPHLLKVYDAEFLIGLVVDTKRRRVVADRAAMQQNACA